MIQLHAGGLVFQLPPAIGHEIGNRLHNVVDGFLADFLFVYAASETLQREDRRIFFFGRHIGGIDILLPRRLNTRQGQQGAVRDGLCYPPEFLGRDLPGLEIVAQLPDLLDDGFSLVLREPGVLDDLLGCGVCSGGDPALPVRSHIDSCEHQTNKDHSEDYQNDLQHSSSVPSISQHATHPPSDVRTHCTTDDV